MAVNGAWPTGRRNSDRRKSQDWRAFPPVAPSSRLPASFPAPTRRSTSQEGNFPVFEGTSLYSLRIDHNVGTNHRLTLRANVSPSTVTGIEVSGQDQPFGQNAYSRTSQQTYRDVDRSGSGYLDGRQQQGQRIPLSVRPPRAVLFLQHKDSRQARIRPSTSPATPTSDASLIRTFSASSSAISSPTISPGPSAATTPSSAPISTIFRCRQPSP
jgi:hypothetical protein